MSSSEVRAAGLIIFRRMQQQIEYLLMQTSYGEHHWSPPKGHVDPGEDDMTTALRETQEEAGLTNEHFSIIDNFKKELHYEVRGKPKVVVYWLAELRNPNTSVVMSSEHQDFRWLPLKEACVIAKYSDMIQTLNDSEQFIVQNKS